MNWRYRHTVLVAAFLASFSNNAARLVISPVVPEIIVAFDSSKSAIGLALTGMWAVYALLQFPSGLVADRIGDYRVILVAIGVTAAASALLAFSPTFALFGLFTVVLGGGAGLYFTVGTSMLTKAFTRTGQVLGVHSAGGPAAGLLVPPVAAYVGVTYGWRPAVLVGAAVSVPAFVLFRWGVRPVSAVGGQPDTRAGDVHPDGGTATALVETAIEVLTRPSVVYMTLVGVCVAYTWQAFTSFFPTFLVEYRGLSVQEASVVFGAVFLLSALGLPLSGKLSDRFARETVLASVLLTAAVGLGTVIVADGFGPTLVGVCLLGAGLSWGGVFQSRVMDLFDDDGRGAAFGLVRTVYMFVGSLGSVVTGVLADSAGWPAAYGVVVLLLTLAIAGIVANRALGIGL